MSRQRTLRAAIGLSLAAALSSVNAGNFLIGSGPLDRIVHVKGYPTSANPVGANYVVTICLDPVSTPATAEQAARNVAAEFNRLQGTNVNVALGPGQVDFESMLMHELGHCMGLDHNALGPSELMSGDLNNAQLYFTNAKRGPNAAFDTTASVDTVRGTRDDVRLDDQNFHWFRPALNDPFAVLPAVIDQTTYTVNTASLPIGHTFVEAATSFSPCSPGATANTSALRGVAGTTSVMFPVLCTNNTIRRLARDDVATLRIARAGYNGVANNSDDYTWQVQYVGRTTACDIPISFVPDASTGFAQCNVGLFVPPAPNGDDRVISSAAIIARASQNWFYNQTNTTGGTCIFRGGFENVAPICN